MNTTQYTIRSVPQKVDDALRQKSKQSGKSLNAILVESLKIFSGVTEAKEIHNDLDWFIGSSNATSKKSTDEMDDWLDSAPKDLR